jgi:hypothetical protein
MVKAALRWLSPVFLDFSIFQSKSFVIHIGLELTFYFG